MRSDDLLEDQLSSSSQTAPVIPTPTPRLTPSRKRKFLPKPKHTNLKEVFLKLKTRSKRGEAVKEIMRKQFKFLYRLKSVFSSSYELQPQNLSLMHMFYEIFKAIFELNCKPITMELFSDHIYQTFFTALQYNTLYKTRVLDYIEDIDK